MIKTHSIPLGAVLVTALAALASGSASDIPGGGPAYLQLVGSHRLSTELGDRVEQVNNTEAMPFHFDYQFDGNGDPENIYCRSDHYNYARLGIPVVFFTTVFTAIITR